MNSIKVGKIYKKIGVCVMKLTKFEKPVAVEHLVFMVKPELLKKWLDLDHEIWTLGLEKWPGFAGKETWINSAVDGEIHSIVYWSDMDLWKSIDVNWLIETDNRFSNNFLPGEQAMIREEHKQNQCYKVNEYK